MEKGWGGGGIGFRAREAGRGGEVGIRGPHAVMIKDDALEARLKREIQSLVELSHPNIVKVMDVGGHDGLPFAVVQYVGGGSLEDRCLPCTPAEVAAWLPDAAAMMPRSPTPGSRE